MIVFYISKDAYPLHSEEDMRLSQKFMYGRNYFLKVIDLITNVCFPDGVSFFVASQ